MNTTKKILLLGFAPFEKSTFESFFKLVGRRGTLYQIVSDVAQAQVFLVNGDNPTAVQWTHASVAPPQKALYIGASDPSGKWPAAPRPIKLTTVLGLLDLLVMADKTAIEVPRVAEATVIAKAVAALPPVPEPIAAAGKRSGSVRQGSGRNNLSDFGASNFMGLGQAPSLTSAAQQFDDILGGSASGRRR